MERFKIEKSLDISEKEAAELSLDANRNLEEYKHFLRLTDEDLSGKKILDLGSGQATKFANETEKQYPNTKVISFDFSFGESGRNKSDEISKLEENNQFESNRVRGVFTKLPFKNESFDTVVSSAAMPLYLNNKEQIREAFKEVIRILRKGGKARLGPVTYTDIIDADPQKEIWETHRKHSYEESKKMFEEILWEFQKQIKFKFLPEEEKVQVPGKYYFGSFKDKIIKTAVLIITKKGNTSSIWDKFRKK